MFDLDIYKIKRKPINLDHTKFVSFKYSDKKFNVSDKDEKLKAKYHLPNEFYEEIDNVEYQNLVFHKDQNILTLPKGEYFRNESGKTEGIFRYFRKLDNENIWDHVANDIIYKENKQGEVTAVKLDVLPPFQKESKIFYSFISQRQILKYFYDMMPKQVKLVFVENDIQDYGAEYVYKVQNMNIQKELSVFYCFESLIKLPHELFMPQGRYKEAYLSLINMEITLKDKDNVEYVVSLIKNEYTFTYTYVSYILGRTFKYLVNADNTLFYKAPTQIWRSESEKSLFCKKLAMYKLQYFYGIKSPYPDFNPFEIFKTVFLNNVRVFNVFIYAYKETINENSGIKEFYELIKIGDEYKYNLTH